MKRFYHMTHITKSLIVANDIVGLGKVALSAALPILSACQIEVIPLPTVLLSSHTGGFENISITDLTDATAGFLSQWRQLPFQADGLMTGYVKSPEQLQQIADFASQKGLVRFVDPIMADNGRLYAGYEQSFVAAMRAFCQEADIITPNLTEACLLADVPYLGDAYDLEAIEHLLTQLTPLNNKHIILTGVSFEAGSIGLAHWDREKASVSYHFVKAYPQNFFGTGDVLSAILAAGYFHGLSLDAVTTLALDIIDKILSLTLELERDIKWGLCYEPYLGDLASRLMVLKEEKE